MEPSSTQCCLPSSLRCTSIGTILSRRSSQPPLWRLFISSLPTLWYAMAQLLWSMQPTRSRLIVSSWCWTQSQKLWFTWRTQQETASIPWSHTLVWWPNSATKCRLKSYLSWQAASSSSQLWHQVVLRAPVMLRGTSRIFLWMAQSIRLLPSTDNSLSSLQLQKSSRSTSSQPKWSAQTYLWWTAFRKPQKRWTRVFQIFCSNHSTAPHCNL